MANDELLEAIRGLAIDAGTVSTPQAKGANLLQDSTKNWKHNAHVNRLVKIIAGTGAGQQFRIKSNTDEILVIDDSWEQRLDTTSVYLIVGTDTAQMLRDVFGQGSDIGPSNPLEVHDPKVASLLSFEGTTTGDGAGDGSTLVCSDLTTKPDFDGNLVVITSGPFAGQARDIAGSTTGGTVNPHLNFGGQVTSGTDFVIAAIRTVPAEVAALATKIGTNTDPSGTTTIFARLRQIVDSYLADAAFGLSALKALIDAIEGKLDKLAGETPVTGSTTANWNSGMATSGFSGADLVTIGANDTKYKLHSLIVDISNCQAGGKITIRMYMQVNGVERKVYEEDFSKSTDPDGVWVVNGSVGIHEALRVECQSNKAADDGVAIGYDYMLEAM